MTGISYEFYALYGGDSNYLSSQSPPDSLLVNQVTPIVSCSLSSSTITLGGSVTAAATADGVLGVVPTEGPMYFFVSTDGGSTWTLFDTESLNAAGSSTSISYTPSASSGTGVSYEFYADYSCDNNYLEANSTLQTLTVNQAPTTTTSSLSLNTITLGNSVTDQLNIDTSASGSLPPATGTWTVYAADNSAMTGEVSIDSETVSGALTFLATTVAWAPPQAGTWYFQAVYSGDSDYAGSTSSSTVEVIVVNAAPTVSIAPVGPITLDVGQSQTFTAAASGGTGTLTYQWYLNASPVGTDSNTYSLSKSSGSYIVTCKVTDSASVPVSAISNIVSVTVHQLTVTVTQTANGMISPATSPVNYGDTPIFTITPDTGYYLSTITVNGASVIVTSVSGQTYQFSPVSTDGSITATFQLDPSTTSSTPTPTPTSPTPTPTTDPLLTSTGPSPTPTPKTDPKSTLTVDPTSTPATDPSWPKSTPSYLGLLSIILVVIIAFLILLTLWAKRRKQKTQAT